MIPSRSTPWKTASSCCSERWANIIPIKKKRRKRPPAEAQSPARREDGLGTPWKLAIAWYATGILPVMRAMTREQLLAVSRQAKHHSLHEPLHLCGAERRFLVPLWSEKPISAGHVVALMVTALWVLCQENEGLAAGLMSDWGGVIAHARALTTERDGTKQVIPYVVPTS